MPTTGGEVPAQLCTIELFKEAMKFSAGHFTLFSATRRERLHGHNFQVAVSITGEVGDDGMMGDYTVHRARLLELCARWNEYFLLPGESPWLKIHQDGRYVFAQFGDEIIPFLAKDVLVLPVRNVTLEELARVFVEAFVEDAEMITRDRIYKVEARVSSNPGQNASFTWQRPQLA